MTHALGLHQVSVENLSQNAKDNAYMAEALRLARKGRFTTNPNPRVGCVLVRDGRIVGRGWHRKAGGPHAEIHAIRQAGDLSRGACAYVTLEPCSHFGKTPPCADALIQAGVVRVVAAIEDPNPQVAGKGMEKLKNAGIEVKTNVLSAEAKELNKGFIKRMETGVPWLSIKMAMSVDGRTAMASGESQWITGPEARSDVQRLRAESSAVLTGIGTILQDDAALTVRAEQFDLKKFETDVALREQIDFDGVMLDEVLASQPLRVVFDSQARLPLDARLLTLESPILWVVSEGLKLNSVQLAISQLPFVEILFLPDLSSADGLRRVLEYLAKQGCNQVLLEAGSNLAGSFVDAGLWDEMIIFMAPKLLGGRGRPLFNLPIDKMMDAKAITLTDIRQFGDDVRFIYHPARPRDIT